MKSLAQLTVLLLLATLPGQTQAQDDWAKATEPRAWSFPADHGMHPEYKTEWWYLTGHLQEKEGPRAFGYQLTFFRQGLKKDVSDRASAWTLRDLYFGHFTVGDFAKNIFHVSERINRGTMGEARYAEGDLDLQLDDWTLKRETGRAEDRDIFVAEAHGHQGQDMQLKIRLRAMKIPVFQGDKGLSQKGPEPGNASHYYSITRMQTAGTLTLEGKSIDVEGVSWFDREFSTSALGKDLAGWDWFSIQLDNNEEWMLYQLRNKDGKADSFSRAARILADGSKEELEPKNYHIDVLETWTSPMGTVYPAKWRIRFLQTNDSLIITPKMADQELRLQGLGELSYWEGACQVEGTWQGKNIKGQAFVELTGYSKAMGREMKGSQADTK